MPRFMDTLMWTDWRVRKRFLEACIVADDLKVLDAFPEFGFKVGDRVFLIGWKNGAGFLKHNSGTLRRGKTQR
ncbi:MAG: hypothetical protein SAMD01599839_21970 [Rectinema sp.]